MSEEIQRLFIEAKKEIEMPKEELLEKLWNLQQRVHDAIEYIEWQRVHPQYDNVWRNYECDDLIKILKGKEE